MLTNMEIAFKINQADINNQFETYDIALQSHEKPLNRSDFSNASNTATKRRPPYVFTKVCVAPIAVMLTTAMANIIVITGHSLRTMNKIIILV